MRRIMDAMSQRPRRTETPVTTTVAVLQGLRWGPESAQKLIVAIADRTRGHVNIHVGLVYRALGQLVDRKLVKKVEGGRAAMFALTAKGKTVAQREGAALARLFAAR